MPLDDAQRDCQSESGALSLGLGSKEGLEDPWEDSGRNAWATVLHGEMPPARLHGDLWPGNVLWSADGTAYLIDPAAQGGHRETDLATLALFGGAPHLERLLDGYQEVWPLAEGWRRRVPLHQLHLLLVHTALFGASYRTAVMSAVRATVDG